MYQKKNSDFKAKKFVVPNKKLIHFDNSNFEWIGVNDNLNKNHFCTLVFFRFFY